MLPSLRLEITQTRNAALIRTGYVAGAFDSSGIVDLATVGPLEVSVEQMLCVTDEGTVAALLHVNALRSTPSSMRGLSVVSEYPLRSGNSLLTLQ